MRYENGHPPGQELLLAADGELSRRRKAAVDAHLEACWTCRARMQEMESSIADFSRCYREIEPELGSIDGPRALLVARLAQLAAESHHTFSKDPPWEQ
jgi:anti-sigma factor RsiW